MKLNIIDIDTFNIFLSALVKFVGGAEFVVKKNQTSVNAFNEVIRGFFTTSSLVIAEDEKSLEEIRFCFSDVSKLYKVLSLLSSSLDKNSPISLEFDGTFLSYNAGTSFKLKTIKKDLIEKYITQPIKSQIDVSYSFSTKTKDVRSIIQASNIVSNDENRVYFVMKGTQIFAEIDNKNLEFNDSIGLPLAQRIEGNVSRVVSIRMQDFVSFALLDSNQIKVSFINDAFFMVESTYECQNKSKINIVLYIPTLKG